ncbi:MAG TPA: dienelactone hydrolase family protein [Solirubrobacterales bacterium]
MAKVILLHSAQGLRPGVEAWAERLRGAGHEVWAPDLFEGRTFDTLEEGIAHRDELGVPELMRRAEAALAGLPDDVVYAGFSMGAASAGYYAATRSGCRGAVLISGVTPLARFGVEAWPAGVGAQVHFTAEDPQVDRSGVAEFEDTLDAARARLEIHVYPGSGHLFADPDSPGYDAAAAELMLARVLEFLSRLGA